LADRSGLSLSTIKDYEQGTRTPLAANLARLQAVFEQQGLVITDSGISTAAAMLDAFAKRSNPSAEERAQAALLAHRLAEAGGRTEPLSEGAAAIVRAYELALGLRTEDDQ
jgi:transcriptional regulator with XRE-family HTH domain